VPDADSAFAYAGFAYGASILLKNSKGSREMTILIETTHIQITDSTEPEYLMDDMSGALADVSVSCCTCSCSCCC
jgi:hypothetical protein